MSLRFYKHKLLLDEGFYYRKDLPITNNRFDVKHVAGDYKRGASSDTKVYELAKQEKRLLVTLNIKHFKALALTSRLTGVIGISPNLTLDQIDKKLTALLNKSTQKSLLGKLTTINK